MTMKDFSYHVRRHGRAKRLGVTVYPDARVVITAPMHASDGAILRYVRQYEEWIRGQLADLSRYKDHVFLPSGRRDYLRHKEHARLLAHSLLERHRETYGATYGRVAIKNLKRNWGSCSVKKNLNFNYKIVHVPVPLAEYVVVHELCHLIEFNHSKKFWDLVAQTVPDHKARRKALRRYLM